MKKNLVFYLLKKMEEKYRILETELKRLTK